MFYGRASIINSAFSVRAGEGGEKHPSPLPRPSSTLVVIIFITLYRLALSLSPSLRLSGFLALNRHPAVHSAQLNRGSSSFLLCSEHAPPRDRRPIKSGMRLFISVSGDTRARFPLLDLHLFYLFAVKNSPWRLNPPDVPAIKCIKKLLVNSAGYRDDYARARATTLHSRKA